MLGMLLVVVSVAELNCGYLSPISGSVEHHSLSTYDTMKLCKRSMKRQMEGPIGLCEVLSMFQLDPRSVRECCVWPFVSAAVIDTFIATCAS